MTDKVEAIDAEPLIFKVPAPEIVLPIVKVDAPEIAPLTVSSAELY